MKYLLGLTSLLLILTSCNSNPSLCECVKAGDNVNKLSAKFFDLENRTPETIKAFEAAKHKRDSLCKPYINMMPDELHKHAAECESLQINDSIINSIHSTHSTSHKN